MRKLLRHWPLTLAALLAILCGVCVWRLWAVSNCLLSQKAAQRWQGTGERSFAQISCYLPPLGQISLDDIYKFRNDMAQKLKGAGYDIEKETGLYRDAWSAFRSVKVANGRRSGEVRAVAVGGNFFDFHPLRLVSGSYLTPNDVMDDRVLLDRETAWLLFGASDVAGLSFSIEGIPVVVAGVYEHERDTFSKIAYGDAMTVYISFNALQKLNAGASVTTGKSTNGTTANTAANASADGMFNAPVCYELVMAEPVKGFTYSSVTDKFPTKQVLFAENTYRFEVSRLLTLLKNRVSRSMSNGVYTIPYWENAARAAEDRAAMWLAGAVVTGALPAGLVLYWVIRSLVRGKKKLQDDVLPDATAKGREFFREQSRRRWEKKHPGEY